MGRLLKKCNQIPELAITSTAIRDKKTLEISMLAGKWRCTVIENGKLYYGSVEEIIESVRFITDKYSSVILVGHEPKYSTLANLMINGSNIVFKTATMVRIDSNVEKWEKIELGNGELRWLWKPFDVSPKIF